jgi:2-keto-4-pentenoate hydratase
MDPDRSRRIALHLAAELAARRPYAWLQGELKPASMAEAYAAQDALLRLWAETGVGHVVGWKIALTSKAIQDLVGADRPCVGAVLDTRIHRSPATIALAGFVRLGLEFELAVRVARPMTGVPGGYDAASARAAVDAVAPAFELVEDRGADYATFDVATIIADNCWNGGIVLGPELPGWEAVDWRTQPVTLTYGEDVERAVTGEALGDPFAALAVVAENLLERGHHLQPGQWVMTGSTLKTRFAKPGDKARYAIDGMGAVEMTVTA